MNIRKAVMSTIRTKEGSLRRIGAGLVPVLLAFSLLLMTAPPALAIAWLDGPVLVIPYTPGVSIGVIFMSTDSEYHGTPDEFAEEINDPPPGIEWGGDGACNGGKLCSAYIGTPDPGTTGEYITIQRAHYAGDTADMTVRWVPVPVITTTTLASMTVGTSASATVGVETGIAPYSWSISAGSLPPGMSLGSSSGTVSGTPTTAGSYSFTVRVTDKNGQTDTQAFVVTVNPSLRLTSSQLPATTVSAWYSHGLSSTGGTAPLAWAGIGLPEGVSVNPTTGRVQGTFFAPGDVSLHVRVTDANGATERKFVHVMVYDKPQITTTSIPSFQMGQPVMFPVNTSGGMEPFVWSTKPALPAGLSIGSDGIIRGTPAAAGAFPQTFRIVDQNKIVAEAALVVEVTGQPPFDVSPDSLSFEAPAGGPATAPQPLVITSAPPFAGLEIGNSAGWLSVSLDEAQTPAVLNVMALPGNLEPGEYATTLEISGPLDQSVPVTLTVTPESGPGIAVDPREVEVSVSPSYGPFGHLLLVNSAGEEGDVSAQLDPPSDWMSVDVGPALEGSGHAATLLLTVDAANLSPGTYHGSLIVSQGASSVTVPVTVNVTALGYELSHSGFSFDTVVGGTDDPSQQLRIFNHDDTPLDWAASTASPWLHLEPPTGTASSPSSLDLIVDPSGLGHGVYSGSVTVAPQGGGEQRHADVRLNVSMETLAPRVAPTGLLLNSAVDGPARTRGIVLTNPNGSPVGFTAVVAPAGAASWLTVTPMTGTMPGGESATLTVWAQPKGLPAGVHRAQINLAFAGQTVQVVDVALIISGESCEPSALVPLFTKLGDQFRARAGWPAAIEVQVMNDCGQPVSQGTGLVWFSNSSENAVPLRAGPDGLWTATWIPGEAHSSITATAAVETTDRSQSGSASSTGTVVEDIAP